MNSASEIASSVQSRVGVSSAVFAHAFVDGSTSFDDYVTDVYWDSATGSWTFKKRDGTIVPGTKLTVYFSEPAYISIENNTLYNLTVNGLTVLGRSAINSTSATGYGYVFAENGVIENAGDNGTFTLPFVFLMNDDFKIDDQGRMWFQIKGKTSLVQRSAYFFKYGKNAGGELPLSDAKFVLYRLDGSIKLYCTNNGGFKASASPLSDDEIAQFDFVF